MFLNKSMNYLNDYLYKLVKKLDYTDRLAQLVERRTTEREVSGSSPRPDQHSGS